MRQKKGKSDQIEQNLLKYKVQQDLLNVFVAATDVNETLTYFERDHPLVLQYLNILISQVNNSNQIHFELMDDLDRAHELWLIKSHCKQVFNEFISQLKFSNIVITYLQLYMAKNLTKKVIQEKIPLISQDNDQLIHVLGFDGTHLQWIEDGKQVSSLQPTDLLSVYKERQIQVKKLFNKISNNDLSFQSNDLNESFIQSQSQKSIVSQSQRSIMLIGEQSQKELDLATFAKVNSSQGSPMKIDTPKLKINGNFYRESENLMKYQVYSPIPSERENLKFSQSQISRQDSFYQDVRNQPINSNQISQSNLLLETSFQRTTSSNRDGFLAQNQQQQTQDQFHKNQLGIRQENASPMEEEEDEEQFFDIIQQRSVRFIEEPKEIPQIINQPNKSNPIISVRANQIVYPKLHTDMFLVIIVSVFLLILVINIIS